MAKTTNLYICPDGEPNYSEYDLLDNHKIMIRFSQNIDICNVKCEDDERVEI